MITIIAGTDRANSNTLKVAKIAQSILEKGGEKTEMIDLSQLPPNLFQPSNYGAKSPEFAPYQKMILETDGILNIVPEYNGSYPGAIKYFIDLLKFPESLHRKPAGFIGLAAGIFAGVRAVEHLEMVYSYREANLFGQRVFIPKVRDKISADGKDLTDKFLSDMMNAMLENFAKFVKKLS
jgi:chromate reductase, NAD(P)H dehydrogenase (quinone)